MQYRVGTLGSAWRRVQVRDNDLAWHNDALGALVQLNASCEPGGDVPLTALTQHLLIGFTERDIRSQTTVPLDAREALRSEVVAKLDGVPRHLVLYVLKKDDCVYDFALVGPNDARAAEATASFDAFVGGFSAPSSATP